MDILNDNDDTNMEDSTNNNNDNDVDSSLNDNNRDGDGINHERLRALSNYADQNQDYSSWYWNEGNVGTVTQQRPPSGWQVYRPLSDLSEVEREEIRVGETRMVSYKNPERYEGTGISLDWGEYYVADDEMGSSDGEESSLSSCEEVNEEEFEKEDRQARESMINDSDQIPFEINFDQLDTNVTASNPTLMGMPDIILERILHYSAEEPSEVCVLERVCKRVRRLTTGDDFWARHPASSRRWSRCIQRTNFYEDKLYTAEPPFTRDKAFHMEALRNIRKYQKGAGRANVILDVLRLRDGEECVADTFRNLSAYILSRMNHLGPEAHFRLRGDTIGYKCELLQGFMIDRLKVAVMFPIHRLLGARRDISRTVQRDDIALAFQKDMFNPFFCGHSPQRPPRCSVSTGGHGQGSVLDCSCSLPSSSGIIWKWPSDNCHDVLPPEAGRRIIRRLAYQAGIVQMSNEAFILAEAEMLHALGILLVTAYESSVEMAKIAQFLDKEKEVSYNEPTISVDMFNTPPPPFHNDQLVYTIVPGQIRTAAEERDITPSHVYGDVWVASSGFTKEEEEEIERSYYYKDNESSNEDDESEEVEGEEKSAAKQKAEPAGDGNGSDTSAWSECSSVEDSEMDMDDYEEDSYLAEYRHGRDEIEAHYNHFPLNVNAEDEPDNGEDDNDEDMAVDNDA